MKNIDIIKILIVTKDNPEFLKNLLNNSEYLPHTEIDIATSIVNGVSKLKEMNYDIVLLDPILPNGEGVHVYKRIRQHCSSTPIIIISDNEDMSLELVKAGAQDHHLKSAITEKQLSKSIQYAIKRKEIEHALYLEKNTNLFMYETISTMYNSITDILWSKNSKMQYNIVNKPFLNTLKVKESDVIGNTITEILSNYNPDVMESDEIVLKTKKEYQCIERVYLNNGTILWWDVIKTPIFSNNKIKGIVGTARDITARIRDEERIKEKLDHDIRIWKESQEQTTIEIKESLADTKRQINAFKDKLNEYNKG